jgi:hypothetical protein
MPLGGTCFGPGDLEFMARILVQTLPPSASQEERELQAASLVCLYGSGLTDRARLTAVLKRNSRIPQRPSPSVTKSALRSSASRTPASRL